MKNCLLSKLISSVQIDEPHYVDAEIISIWCSTANVNNHSIIFKGKATFTFIDDDAYFVGESTSSTTSIGTSVTYNSSNGAYLSFVASHTGPIRIKVDFIDAFNFLWFDLLYKADLDRLILYSGDPTGLSFSVQEYNKNEGEIKITLNAETINKFRNLIISSASPDTRIEADLANFAGNTIANALTLIGTSVNVTGSIINLRSTILTRLNFNNKQNVVGSLEEWAALQVSLGRTSGNCTWTIGGTGISVNGQTYNDYVQFKVTFGSSLPNGYSIERV